MGFEMVEARRMPEAAEAAGLVYSVLTILDCEADGCLDMFRLYKVLRMLVVVAGVHIHSVGIHGRYNHWRMREGLAVI